MYLCLLKACDSNFATSTVPSLPSGAVTEGRTGDKRSDLSVIPYEADLHTMYGDRAYHELPIVHLTTTRNNTKATLTDCNYRSLCTTSCGCEGFHNARKQTTVAAQTVGISIGLKAQKLGIKDVRVKMRGIGPNRLPKWFSPGGFSRGMSFLEHRDFRSEHSSGSLRFKISVSKQEMEHEEPESASSDSPFRTSYSLYVVLSEIHRLCVKRDHKGIFAKPVTEDIAPDYFSIISHPMDLGTMYSRLESRNYYSNAGQFLSDVRLMCENAMCYNPPDTIYYQKARKLLTFVEKQMTPHSLRKLSAELLKMSRPLTDEEIRGQLGEYHHHPHQQQQQVNRYRQDSQNQHCAQAGTSTARYSITSTGGIFTPPKLQEEEEMEEVELLEDEEDDRERPPTESSSSPVLSLRKRRPSSASISSSSKMPRYNSSPPLLVPEVEDSVGRVDSPLTQSTCGRNDSDVVTIDLEATEIDLAEASLTLSPASSTISSSTLRGGSRKSKRRGVAVKASAPTPPSRSLGSSRSRRKNGCRPSTSPLLDRVYSEDTWTFPDCPTDRSSPAQVVAQARHAARAARAKFLARYGRSGHQTIVYLDTTEPGKIYAKPCGDSTWTQNEEDGEIEKDQRKLVDYPLALRQLLTPKPQPTGQGVYHGLVEQMTSQQVATLHALSKLRYASTEPVGMGIHGPLAIFEKEELAQLCDAYGGDVMTMESVLSLLTFVEPLGEWARRWAHRRLDSATDGYHGKMLLAFADPTSEFHASNWMKRAGLTIDSSVVEEFKAENAEEKLGKEPEPSQASPETTEHLPSSICSDFQALEVDSTGSGHMSMAKMPSNTSTTNTTVKQMATVQPLQRLVSPSCASSDDKSIASNTLETCTTGADRESEDEEEEEVEDGETFDILSAALDASVTPATSEQISQQQPQQQQYVLTTYCVMESGATSAVLEAPGNPTIAANPLAASVNDIAQISALTAAISPIQTLPALSATCIGLPASVTGEGGCSSSTLLVVDRKIEEDNATLGETLPMELDLEPSSEDSPKDSASEGSPRKGAIGEEEATDGESENSLLEVGLELQSQETSKESLLPALIPPDTLQNSAPLKVPFETNQTFIDVVADSPIPTKVEMPTSVTNEPEFPVVKAFLEASEGDISSKLGSNEVKESSLNSPPIKGSFPQEPALVQSSDTSVLSVMDSGSSEVSRYSSVGTLENPHGSHSTDTDGLGVRETGSTPTEEFAVPSLQMDADGAAVSMESLQPTTAEVNSTFSDEKSEDLRGSCGTGLNDPVVDASDFSIIQESSKLLVQNTSEIMNLDRIERPVLEGGPPEASAPVEPFQNPVQSDMGIEFGVVRDPLIPSENTGVSRDLTLETDRHIFLEKPSEILSKVESRGDVRLFKETQSCAFEVHQNSSDKVAEEPQQSPAPSKVTDVVNDSSNKESLKESPLQAFDSMEFTPRLSNGANPRICEEAGVLVDDDPESPIFGKSLEAISMTGKSSEQASVQVSSAILPQRIETEVESLGEGPLQTSNDVEGPVNLFKVSITEVTDCPEPKLIEGILDNGSHFPDVSSSSEDHISAQLLCEDAMDIPTPLERNLPQDESKHFVSSEESPLEAESFKYKATDHHIVNDPPAGELVLLESPNHPIEPTFSSEVETAGIETTPNATETREMSDVSVVMESSSGDIFSGHEVVSSRIDNQVHMEMDDTLQSYPCQYEVDETKSVFSSCEREEMCTRFCDPPSHSKLMGGDSNHSDLDVSQNSASDRSFPPPSAE
ncbi:Bromodomain-containing protein 9 [Taenia crassiceps]|uniref:Bromodomain-containing protein 9 n=1 Tax=Taenia crassiceps TaxID=6207 RepID=A0ABR4QLH5_9CEST